MMRIYRKDDRRYNLNGEITAKASSSNELYTFSLLLIFLLENCNGCTRPSYFLWDRTAPTETEEASVSTMKDISKSGKARTGGVVRKVSILLNAEPKVGSHSIGPFYDI